jgi:hypothetical protein
LLKGDLFKLAEYSALLFDIKKFNMKTGEMEDFGFAF